MGIKSSNDKDTKGSKIIERILNFFRRKPKRPLRYNQLSKELSIENEADKSLLNKSLRKLEDKLTIYKKPNGSFQLADSNEEYEGIVDHVNPLFGFIVVEGREDDIRISTKHLGTALHGDRVRVAISEKRATVRRIIQRARNAFVGKVYEKHGSYYVEIDGRRYHRSLKVSNKSDTAAKPKDKVIIEVQSWPDMHEEEIVGTIVKVLGISGEHKAEMDSIIFEHDIEASFSDEVEKEAEELKFDYDPRDNKRRDLRDVLTMTIDPENAKDFDDALSIRSLSEGKYEIGIHIADVSHYIPVGSSIDQEALKRGNSVYLVDRVIPMLPERLSNELCSLRPNEDKFTYSVIFEIDMNGKVYDNWIGETVIHSNKRFIYEEAQEVLNSNKGEYLEELKVFDHIAKKLRKQRFDNGAIEFHSTEYKIAMDEYANPINITRKKVIDTNQLVEEYMLLANRTVAKKMEEFKKINKNLQFIYRTHEDPDDDKIDDFARYLKVLGYNFDKKRSKLPSSFNRLNQDFKDRIEGPIVQYMGIRTMSRAQYTPQNIGHFGLGFEFYTHFTSPIRRYADLLVHRFMKSYLYTNFKQERFLDIREISKHLSMLEKKAQDAERASIKYKQIIFLQSLKGKEIEGIISYISERALYIEAIETGCEGVIYYSSIKGDYLEYDSEKFCVRGRRTGVKYNIGQKVTVKVAKTDLDKRVAELEFVK